MFFLGAAAACAVRRPTSAAANPAAAPARNPRRVQCAMTASFPLTTGCQNRPPGHGVVKRGRPAPCRTVRSTLECGSLLPPFFVRACPRAVPGQRGTRRFPRAGSLWQKAGCSGSPLQGRGPRLRGRGMFVMLARLLPLRNIPRFAPANHRPEGGTRTIRQQCANDSHKQRPSFEGCKGSRCRQWTFSIGCQLVSPGLKGGNKLPHSKARSAREMPPQARVEWPEHPPLRTTRG